MGVEVYMLTGDNAISAQAISRKVGINHYKAGVLPNEKAQFIKELQANGEKVGMVGDGINDSAALAQADLSIAMGQGSDIAVDTAMATILSSDLLKIPETIRLSQLTIKTIYQNLFWAFIYNVIGIPLAAGVWIPLFGWRLNPMFGAAAMSLSSFCVVTNALRLNLFHIRSTKRDKKIKIKHKKEKATMEKTMKIDGMMCAHCEARVKKALEAFDEVEEAVVSHETGTAVLKLKADVSDAALKKAVEDEGYTVKE